MRMLSRMRTPPRRMAATSEHAATCIQRHVRGDQARFRVAAMLEQQLATIEQSNVHLGRTMSEMIDERVVEAATTVQAYYRARGTQPPVWGLWGVCPLTNVLSADQGQDSLATVGLLPLISWQSKYRA